MCVLASVCVRRERGEGEGRERGGREGRERRGRGGREREGDVRCESTAVCMSVCLS